MHAGVQASVPNNHHNHNHEAILAQVATTASGEWIPDGGAWQFQGFDENGLLRSLNGRLTGVHKVLCSAAEIASDVTVGA